MEPLDAWEKYIDPQFRERAIRIRRDAEGNEYLEFDGRPVNDSDHLVRLVQYTPVGTTVEMTFLRRSVRRSTEVTLGNRSELLEMALEEEER